MLRIKLDSSGSVLSAPSGASGLQASTLFKPGQLVSGKVHLDLQKDDEISKVFIKFNGKIQTSITTGSGNNRRTRTHTSVIFRFEKLLFDGGAFKMRATNYEWPFVFQFPEEFNGRPTDLDPGVRGFTLGPQPLPPSCSDESSRVSGRVTYYLKARVPKTFLDMKTTMNLRFSPLRVEALPHSMHIPKNQIEAPRTQKYRYDVAGPRSLTTKESFSDKFHSKTETQTTTFRAEMSAPTTIVIGKPYPILLTLRVQEADDKAKVIPEFTVDQIEAHLKSYTQVRVDATFGDRTNDFESVIPLLNSRPGLKIKLSPDETIPLMGVFPEGTYAAPTFSTTSIFRTYRLTVHLKIRCLDDIFKVSCKWMGVLLLPVHMADGVEEAAQMMSDGNFTVSEGPPAFSSVMEAGAATDAPSIAADVPPPTYKEAAKS